MVLEAGMPRMMGEPPRPVVVDDEEMAPPAQAEVGPGGHFFGAGHTLARFEAAFYQPLLSDWRNHGAWREAGAPGAARRALRIWKALLDAYEPPPLAPDRREALMRWVARRKEEIRREGLR
jgi:trimethylamine---corrinoid protein Co-methyltransferase